MHADVLQTIDRGALPAREQGVINDIRQRNDDIRHDRVVFDLAAPYRSASLGFADIRSAHGLATMRIPAVAPGRLRTLFSTRGEIGNLYVHAGSGKKKVKLCWLSYAQEYAPAHVAGRIPTLVEFNGNNAQSRILIDYARDLVFYTANHYATYQLVTFNGQPARTMDHI